MVTFIRKADVNGIDKQQKAVEWAKTVGQYVDGKFGFSNVECGVEVYGSAGRFYWIGRQRSLDALGKGAERRSSIRDTSRCSRRPSGCSCPARSTTR